MPYSALKSYEGLLRMRIYYFWNIEQTSSAVHFEAPHLEERSSAGWENPSTTTLRVGYGAGRT